MDNARKLKTVILVTGILIIAVLSFAAVEYTSQTGFCNSCHEMNIAYAGWDKGYHQQVHCYECHTDKGFVNKVKVKVNGLKEVYIHVTSDVDMDKVKAEVPESRCTGCHDFNNNDKYIKRITDFHKQHQAMKFTCFTCHGDVGHAPERFIGFRNDACKQCHLPK